MFLFSQEAAPNLNEHALLMLLTAIWPKGCFANISSLDVAILCLPPHLQSALTPSLPKSIYQKFKFHEVLTCPRQARPSCLLSLTNMTGLKTGGGGRRFSHGGCAVKVSGVPSGWRRFFYGCEPGEQVLVDGADDCPHVGQLRSDAAIDEWFPMGHPVS